MQPPAESAGVPTRRRAAPLVYLAGLLLTTELAWLASDLALLPVHDDDQIPIAAVLGLWLRPLPYLLAWLLLTVAAWRRALIGAAIMATLHLVALVPGAFVLVLSGGLLAIPMLLGSGLFLGRLLLEVQEWAEPGMDLDRWRPIHVVGGLLAALGLLASLGPLPMVVVPLSATRCFLLPTLLAHALALAGFAAHAAASAWRLHRDGDLLPLTGRAALLVLAGYGLPALKVATAGFPLLALAWPAIPVWAAMEARRTAADAALPGPPHGRPLAGDVLATCDLGQACTATLRFGDGHELRATFPYAAFPRWREVRADAAAILRAATGRELDPTPALLQPHGDIAPPRD